jgi:hypothetical protein
MESVDETDQEAGKLVCYDDIGDSQLLYSPFGEHRQEFTRDKLVTFGRHVQEGIVKLVVPRGIPGLQCG